MNTAFKLLLLIFLSTALLQCNTSQNPLQTPLEQSGFSAYTSNIQVMNFLNDCSALNPEMILGHFEVSEKKMPLIVFPAKNPETALRVMLLAQQHGNEPSGMEGLLLLIKELALKQHRHFSDSLHLIILPQCNPAGSDLHQRRNQEGVDLNRDHLLITAEETRIMQAVFAKHQPYLTVDFHEYYPFSRSWADFGYRRNFDMQLGGPTNINIDRGLHDLFREEALPFTRQALESAGFSFFEYTVGNFALAERLRHSTVDINDGRQSFAITGAFLPDNGGYERPRFARSHRKAQPKPASDGPDLA
jgi:hypothetical protein